MTFRRIKSGPFDGYECGDIHITDNGNGFGPAKGSGRWALTVAGKWVANYDTLAEAKAAGQAAGQETA